MIGKDQVASFQRNMEERLLSALIVRKVDLMYAGLTDPTGMKSPQGRITDIESRRQEFGIKVTGLYYDPDIINDCIIPKELKEKSKPFGESNDIKTPSIMVMCIKSNFMGCPVNTRLVYCDENFDVNAKIYNSRRKNGKNKEEGGWKIGMVIELGSEH